MTKMLKIGCTTMLVVLGLFIQAHASPEPSSLTDHTDVLVWSLYSLVTLINGIAAYYLKGVSETLKSHEHRLTVVETRCEINHKKE